MSVVLWTSVFSFILPLPPPLLGILMLTGLVVLLHDALLPDIVAVQQICLYMHDPREPHFTALKRILRYVRCTVNLGLQLYASATTSFVSAEAEYRGVANVVAETAWLRNLLLQHQRTKHIEIDIHFIRDMVQTSHIRYTDIYTKGLPTTLFEDFRFSLSVRLPPAQTAGAY
nr:hypothetical protein [Tanacetum cinerariifolium]